MLFPIIGLVQTPNLKVFAGLKIKVNFFFFWGNYLRVFVGGLMKFDYQEARTSPIDEKTLY